MSKIQVNEIVNHFDNGAPDCPRGLTVTGVSTFSGSVSIGGTLSYEDVTNIDSVGIITARDGLDTPTNLVLRTGGTEKLLITSDGRIGLGSDGMSSPTSVLHVFSNSSTDTIKIQGPTSSGNYDVGFEVLRDSTTGGAKMVSMRNTSLGGVGWEWLTTSNNNAEINGTYVSRMVLKEGGNVGIGSTIPRSKLNVNGSMMGNGSHEESLGGDQTIDKTIAFTRRGAFMMLISFSLGTTTTDFTRNIYSFGLFVPRSNGATWTAIQQDLGSPYVGTFTISDNGSEGQLRVQKTAGSDGRQCSFRIDVLSSCDIDIVVTDT